MKKMIALSISLFFLSTQIFPQDVLSKNEEKQFKEIYKFVLDNYFDSTNSFILIDTTENLNISKIEFKKYFIASSEIGDPFLNRLDSSWLRFFLEIEQLKTPLRRFRLPNFSSTHSIRVVSKDSLKAAFNSDPLPWTGFWKTFGWANGWLELSDIILSKSKDKAIIEINHTKGELNGNGFIILIERMKNNKWIIIKRISTWIS